MEGGHGGIRFRGHHREGTVPPDATEEDNPLPRHPKLVLALDGLSRLRRRIRLALARFKERRHRHDTSAMLHRLAPSWLHRALDARVEHHIGLPGLREPPRELARLQTSDAKSTDSPHRVESGNNERHNRFRKSLNPPSRPIRRHIQRRIKLELPNNPKHLVISKYRKPPTHTAIVPSRRVGALPTRSRTGRLHHEDGFERSGARIIRPPFTIRFDRH